MKASPVQSRLSWIATEFVTLFALFLSVWMTLLRWKQLPASIPVHFSLSGEPDQLGPRSTAILLPVIAALLYGGLTFLRQRPQWYQVPWTVLPDRRPLVSSMLQRLLDWVKLEIVLLFAFLQWNLLRVAVGKTTALPFWLPPCFMAVVSATIVVFLVRTSRVS